MTRERKDPLNLFVQEVVQAASSVSLYSAQHRRVQGHLAQAEKLVAQAIADAGELSLIVVQDELFYGGKPLPRTPLLDRFVKGLQGRQIGHLTIRGGIGTSELEHLVMVVAGKAGALSSGEKLRFGSVGLPVAQSWDDENTPGIYSFAEMPENLKKGLATTYEGARSRQRLDLNYILRVVNGFLVALRRGANPFLALVPLRQMDEYTFTHSIDVCILNLAQGVGLGLSGQLLRDVGVAAMLHDIGKMFVPPEVLKKPGNLDPEEWEAMRQHTVKGAEYLLNTPGVPRLAVLSAFEHHLKYDVSGYPKVPQGYQINFCSQMTMISDCFDAMRTRRIYKDAVDFARTAGRMLEIAGQALHPALTLNFLKILHEKGEGATRTS
ncbi:HD domain-containing protein [Geomonas sp. RF6]|uniref:HD-GYP domain-containing protein n=1 Tax=Geomonas sp. RF6 TaxID=2897342 RepID=UPI001E5B76BA|nr:HD domain-containing phosphohydrolase [Geomonas sp. RF6]UFS71136.1 HD domain-containing protein [Geomonas sp. RF6]